MPEWLVDGVNKLMVNSNSCAASFTQRAAIEALTGPQTDVEQMVEQFRQRRAAFCAALKRFLAFSCDPPAGAFYAFANVKGTGMASKDLADLLLEEAGVACLNGGSFGAHGEGYLRFSFANSIENLLRGGEAHQSSFGKMARRQAMKRRFGCRFTECCEPFGRKSGRRTGSAIRVWRFATR